MEWLLGIGLTLLGFVLTAAFLAVVGHPLWLLFAAVFRLISGSKPRAVPPPLPPPLPRQQPEPEPDSEMRLADMRQELRDLCKAGILTAEAVGPVLGEINRRIGRDPGHPPATATVSKPAEEVSKVTAMPGLHRPPPVERDLEKIIVPLPMNRAKDDEPPAGEAEEPAVVEQEQPENLGEILGRFMEARNIRWGEVIGGLLILLCSVALVINFWSQITGVPMLRFAVFTAATAVIFGAGFFVEYRWHLPSTGRGLLIIGSLLAPLNSVAIAAVAHGNVSPAGYGMEVLALAIFGALVFCGGRILSPERAGILAGAVILPCAFAVATGHLGTLDKPGIAAAAALLHILPGAIAAALITRKPQSEVFAVESAERRIVELGVCWFAGLPGFFLVIARSGGWSLDVAGIMAPAIAVCGIGPILGGVPIARGAPAQKNGWWSVAGMGLAIFGGGIIALATLQAAPAPLWLVLTAAIAFSLGLFLLVAWKEEWGHALLFPSLALAGVVSALWWDGLAATNRDWLRFCASLLSRTGAVAAAIAMVGAIVGLHWAGERRAPKQTFGVSGIILALLSALGSLSSGYGLGEFDQYMMAALALGCGTALYWIGVRTRWAIADWSAAVVLFFASVCLWSIPDGLRISEALQAGMLTCASFLLILALLSPTGAAQAQRYLRSALIVTVASIPAHLWAANGAGTPWLAGMFFWLGCIWFAAAIRGGWAAWMLAAQFAVTVAVYFAIESIPYFGGHPAGWAGWLREKSFALAVAAAAFFALEFFVEGSSKRFTVVWQRRPIRLENIILALAVAGFCLISILEAGARLVGDVVLLDQGRVLWLALVLSLVSGFELAVCERRGRGVSPVPGKRACWYRIMAVVWFTAPFAAAGLPVGGLPYLDRLQWAIAGYYVIVSAVVLALPRFANVPFVKASLPEDPRSAPYATLYGVGIPAMLAVAFIDFFGPSHGMERAPLQALLPFLAMAAAQFLHGMARRHNPPLLFAALLTHFGLTSYLIALTPDAEPSALLLAYWNAAACGLMTLAWCALPYLSRPSFDTKVSKTRRCYLYAGLTVLLVAGVIGAAWIFVEPQVVDEDFAYAGSPSGWTAVVAICAAWLVADAVDGTKSKMSRLGLPAFVAVAHVSGYFQASNGWEGMSALAIGFSLAMFVPLSAGMAGRRFPGVMEERFGLDALAASVRNWIKWFALLSLACSARLVFSVDSPVRVTASVALAIGAAAFIALALQQNATRYLVAAAAFLNAGATLWWLDQGLTRFNISSVTAAWDTVLLNAGLLAVPGFCSYIMERRRVSHAPLYPLIGYVAAGALLLAAGCAAASRLLDDVLLFTPGVAWAAWLLNACLLVAAVWRSEFRLEAYRSLHVLGFAAIGFAGAAVQRQGGLAEFVVVLFLGLYSIGSTALVRRLAAAVASSDSLLRWCRNVNILASATASYLALHVSWTLEAATAQIPVALAVFCRGAAGLSLMAHAFALRWVGASRSGVAAMTILAIAVASWAPIEPNTSFDLLLNRAAAAYGGLSFLLWVLIGIRRTDLIGRVCAQLRLVLIGIGLAILGIEIYQKLTSGIAIQDWAIWTIAAAFAGNAVLSFFSVIRPDLLRVESSKAPLEISDRRRMLGVYVAEGYFLALGLHLRLDAAWLFGGALARFWPFLVMGLAFAGVGLAEWFNRQRLRYFAEPFGRTGVLLPLLPVIGFWSFSSEVDYSALLFSAGLLYGMVAVRRASFFYSMVAAAAANGGLWYYLHRTSGFSFIQHPQLWLIPAAASVLIALYGNRERLPAEGFRSARLACAVIIYVSSTADLFINGVATSFWLPLVLGGLSILGVLSGIGLRIRMFLYLGISFLLVDLFAIIWHAASNLGWTWLWYVAGILAGLSLIAVFGLIEKKGPEFRALLLRMKSWD